MLKVTAEEDLAAKLEQASTKELESVLTEQEVKDFHRAAGANEVLRIKPWPAWWSPEALAHTTARSLSSLQRELPKQLKEPLPALQTLTRKPPEPAVVYHGKLHIYELLLVLLKIR